MPSILRRARTLAIVAVAYGIGAPAASVAQDAPIAGDGCTLSQNLLASESLDTPRPDSASIPKTRQDAPEQTLATGAPSAAPSILLYASASARSVRFSRQPEIRVRLCHGADSVRIVERRNLPRRIVPGTVYENVYIAVEVLAHLDGVCLAERLLGGQPNGRRPQRRPGDSSRVAGGASPSSDAGTGCAAASLRSDAGEGSGDR